MPKPQTSRAEAERIIADYKKSGLSRPEYCRKNNVKLNTFNWWMKRHNDSAKNPPSRKTFLRVSPPASSDTIRVADSELTIDFPSGTRLKWRGRELPSSFSHLLSSFLSGSAQQ